MLYAENQQLTNNFNGTYTFGGGTAPALDPSNATIPGATETISGIEQYRRTLLRLPGGTPTAFNNVSGTPSVQFTQVQDAVFVQDDINVGHGLHLQAGLRYALQNDPTTFNAITPRAGFLWSPKHSRFTLACARRPVRHRIQANRRSRGDARRWRATHHEHGVQPDVWRSLCGCNAHPLSTSLFASHLQYQ